MASLLTVMKAGLARELAGPGSAAVLEAARGRVPAFESYASLTAVVEALGRRSSLTNGAKDGLVRALVSEFQGGPHPAWSSALIATFHGLLCALRGRVVSDAFEDDDLAQLLLATLLEQARVLPTDRTRLCCKTLKQRTTQAFFRALEAEQAEAAACDHPDEQEWERLVANGSPWTVKRRRRQQGHEVATSDALRDLLHGDGIPADLRAAIEACARGEPLRDFVERAFADRDEPGRRREYERLKRMRSRVIGKLRRACEAAAKEKNR